MTEQQLEELKLSLRKIIVTHSHIISRVRQDDERTMRVHLMSMLDTLERKLAKEFPGIFTLKSWKTMAALVKHIFKRQHRFCEDDYINQICYIMQAYVIQMKVAKKKNSDTSSIAKEKGNISREAASRLFHLQG